MHRETPQATDWDAYYRSPVPTARLSRKVTQSVLIRLMRRHAPATDRRLRILEIGGGNSCFLDAIRAALDPVEYHVVDSNRLGLELLERRFSGDPGVVTHHADARDLDLAVRADIVFSVGLIEHFDPPGTRSVVDAHFRVLAEGGTAILSFPTPTWLYRTARSAVEAVGAWRFPDERPLERGEVAAAVERHAAVVAERVIWPIVLTQGVIVARRAPARAAAAAREPEGAP